MDLGSFMLETDHLAKNSQLVQGAHLPTLGLEPETSQSPEVPEEGDFSNPPSDLSLCMHSLFQNTSKF